MELLYFNIKLVGACIFAAQVYTVYEYFRFGRVRWHRRVLWWLPDYIPSFIWDRLAVQSTSTDNNESSSAKS